MKIKLLCPVYYMNGLIKKGQEVEMVKEEAERLIERRLAIKVEEKSTRKKASKNVKDNKH